MKEQKGVSGVSAFYRSGKVKRLIHRLKVKRIPEELKTRKLKS